MKIIIISEKKYLYRNGKIIDIAGLNLDSSLKPNLPMGATTYVGARVCSHPTLKKISLHTTTLLTN